MAAWKELQAPPRTSWAERFELIRKADIRVFCPQSSELERIVKSYEPKNTGKQNPKFQNNFRPPKTSKAKPATQAKSPNGQPQRWIKVMKGKDTGRYQDVINGMTPLEGVIQKDGTIKHKEGPTCYDGSQFGAMANGHGPPSMDSKSPYYRQKENRRTVDYCSIFMRNRLTVEKDEWANQVYAEGLAVGLDYALNLLIKTFIHELAHAARPGDEYDRVGRKMKKTRDGIIDIAYSWTDITKLTLSEALRNADSYAFLGVAALYANRGFALQRDKPTSRAESDLLWYGNGVWQYRKPPHPWAQISPKEAGNGVIPNSAVYWP